MTDPTPIPEQPTKGRNPDSVSAPRTAQDYAEERLRDIGDRFVRDFPRWTNTDLAQFSILLTELSTLRAEAAASVPAPEQEEAVRLRLYKALTVYMDKEGCVHVDEPDDMPGFIDAITAALATPPPVPAAPTDALRDARSLIRQLSNDLMWCDTRYRQTLEGKPVRDVTELRHEIVAVLDQSGRFLEQTAGPVPAAPGLDRLLNAGKVLVDATERLLDTSPPIRSRAHNDARHNAEPVIRAYKRIAAEYARLHPADPEEA